MNRRADFLSGSKTIYVFYAMFVFFLMGMGIKVGMGYFTNSYLYIHPDIEYEILRARVLGCTAAAPPGSPTPSFTVVDASRFTEAGLSGCLQEPYKKLRIILEFGGDSHAVNLGEGVPKTQRSLTVLVKTGDTYLPGRLTLGLS